jgi:hypothetical protein
MMRKWWIGVLLRAGAIGVSAAGLGASSCTATYGGSSATSMTNASATGIWSGSDSVSHLGITAMVNAAGQAVFIRADGAQFVGMLQVSGGALAATVDGYSAFGVAFSDGSNFGIGTLNGTVATGGALNAALTFATHGGSDIGGAWALTFEPRSGDGSSSAAVSGNYTDHVSGAVLSITSSGVMSSQNAANGCVLNGAISTADAAHDVYEVAFTYGNCTGAYAPLNGVQFTGLASLNTDISPTQLIVAAAGTAAGSGAAGAGKYGIVAAFDAT